MEPRGEFPGALFEHVEEDCAEDDEAEDYFLAVGLDAGEVHAVLDDGDDEGADEGAEDSALATGEGGSADDDGGDDVEFIGLAIGWGTAFQLRGEDDAAEAGDDAAE